MMAWLRAEGTAAEMSAVHGTAVLNMPAAEPFGWDALGWLGC
jgi:hypothetical protein